MRIQVGRSMFGSLTICGIQVICPQCQNRSNFNSVNVDTTSGGTLQCGACRVWLVITNGKIEIDA